MDVPTFADFLTQYPPGQKCPVSDLGKLGWQVDHANTLLNVPELYLDCEDEQCNGFRNFQCTGDYPIPLPPDRSQCLFLHFMCRNCQRSTKTFSLFITHPSQGRVQGEVFKFGEMPPFGPRTPARVVSLIGPDRDLFLKGRRAENQGLGIGAFAYYRRIVENQKGRLIDEIIKVAKKVGGTPELIEELEAAKKETQFKSAIDCIKHGLPTVILINGHNPLLLLHSALSEGIHAQTDESCLELATSIREVLFVLAEKIGQALKARAGLDAAVARLTQSREQKDAKPGSAS